MYIILLLLLLSCGDMCLQLLAMFVGTSCCCSRYCIQSIFAVNMAFLYVICLCMGVRAIQIWICVSSLIQGKVEYWYLDIVPSSFPKGEYIFRFYPGVNIHMRNLFIHILSFIETKCVVCGCVCGPLYVCRF